MTSNAPQTLKGFRDFLPAQASARTYVMSNMRQTFTRHGFAPMETPTLEYRETIMGKYGEEADKLVYSFVDHGGREVALRYDQTVPTARVISQLRQELPFPFRRYQIQNVFRADKPQKGRYREFTQSDADIFGSTDAVADAEILSLFWHIYANLGLKEVQIHFNYRQDLFALVEQAGISTDLRFSVLQSLDKLDKMPQTAVEQELSSKGVHEMGRKRLFELLHTASPSPALQEIIRLAKELGIPASALSYSPTLVRGLDYYTGLIFESKLPEGGGSLGGGGRYDQLIQELSGTDMPAVGFGIGFDRTVDVLSERGLLPTDLFLAPVLVTIFDPTFADASAHVVTALREKGIATELYPNRSEKIAKQLKHASRIGSPFVILIGSDEASTNTVTVKHMSSGTQYPRIPLEEAIRILCLPAQDLPPVAS